MKPLIMSAIVAIATHSGAAEPASVQPAPAYSCNLAALSQEELATYQKLSQALLAGVQETAELPNGYAFRLPRESLVDAAQWVSYESRCCPFFAFEFELADYAESLWLRISGADGVKEFIRMEFERVIPAKR